MIVVLGGSRYVHSLPYEIETLLINGIQNSNKYFVGDAPGIDTAFQEFLRKKSYQYVKVFSSAGYIRNNLGNWESELIDAGLKSKSNAVHAFKDRHMCTMADRGMMIWDGKSAGTLSNVIDLVAQGKSCDIWVAQNSELINFDSSSDLDKWSSDFPDALIEAKKRLSTFYNRQNRKIKLSSQLGLFE